MAGSAGKCRFFPAAMAVFRKKATPWTVSGSAGLAGKWRCVYGNMDY
jgi:hypothetical protein